MTLPPEKIGDQGQRYVVEVDGWPSPPKGWQDAGYTNEQRAAKRMMRVLSQHPSVRAVRVRDRENPAIMVGMNGCYRDA